VGKDIAVLTLIIWKVILQNMWHQQCRVGMTVAILCEYTKAYMRCLPLLAIVVLIVVASRVILYKRIYYEMLRHGVLLSFERPSPANDPMFRLLFWCTVNALCHFLPLLQVTVPLWGIKALSGEAKEVMIFYCVPMAVFMWFLWTSYNLHTELVPLNAFMEDDPAAARRAIESLVVLDEAKVSCVVMMDFVKEGELCTMGDAVAMIKDIAKQPGSVAQWEQDHHRRGSLLQWRLDSNMWPAHLLLSRRLIDEDSQDFMHMWCNFVVVALVVQLCIFFIFVCEILEDYRDVMAGQASDMMSLMIFTAHLLVVAWLSAVFVRNALVSYRSARARMDLLCCARRPGHKYSVTAVGVSVVVIPVAICAFLLLVGFKIYWKVKHTSVAVA